MFRAGSDLFACVTIQDKTKCQYFSTMMIRSQVYTVLIGDLVVGLNFEHIGATHIPSCSGYIPPS